MVSHRVGEVFQWVDLTDDSGPECIKNGYNSVCKRQLNRKIGKRSEQVFYEEDIQMANKHMKRHSTSLVTRECKLNLQWDNVLPIRITRTWSNCSSYSLLNMYILTGGSKVLACQVPLNHSRGQK